ncbi:MAG TPA: hypothetical protein PLF26_17030 [Blastocatellia bacterium]|nr:hypothetical protein [Blastocatellia bacterium]
MHKVLFALAALLVLSVPVFAQEPEVVTPEAEVFAGYSYFRLYTTNNNGGIGAVTYNVNSWFGITGDFSGYHGTNGGDSNGMVLGGPKFTYRRGPVTPYVQLYGGGIWGGGDSAGVYGFGGGVDAKVSKHVAIRLIQADYLATSFRSNNARISVGIVFRFGEKK